MIIHRDQEGFIPGKQGCFNIKKQAEEVILISHKIDFQQKNNQKRRGMTLHTHQRKNEKNDALILNIYGPKTRVPSFVTEVLLNLSCTSNPTH